MKLISKEVVLLKANFYSRGEKISRICMSHNKNYSDLGLPLWSIGSDSELPV